jgi:Major Facilitator Superfamily
MTVTSPGAVRVTFGNVFSVGEFRAMWLAELLSFMGDQLARVALSVLVFNATGSAALTGLTYGLTYVPAIVGGAVLSGIADRGSRRSIIVTIDSTRTLVVAAAAIPGVPLAWLLVLVSVLSFLGGPYKAAQLALLRDVLDAGQYPVGTAIRQITLQASTVLGFAAGGVLSGAVSPRAGLGVDAATYAASALLVGFFVRSRPGPAAAGPKASPIAGMKLVWNAAGRRAILLMTFLGTFYIVPEGVAAPYVKSLGRGDATVGLLLASTGIGAVIGLWCFSRFVPQHRQPAALPVSCLLAGVPLIGVLAHGGIYVSMILFAAMNAAWSVQLMMCVSFMAEMLPDAQLSQGMGIASSVNLASQGLGTLLAGTATQIWSPAWAIAAAGALSVLYALWPSLLWAQFLRAGGAPGRPQ